MLSMLPNKNHSVLVKFILSQVLYSRPNFLLDSGLFKKLLKGIFCLNDKILLYEWSDFILQFLRKSDLFFPFLMQNGLFNSVLAFLHRNLAVSLLMEPRDIDIHSDKSGLISKKKSPNKTIFGEGVSSNSEVFFKNLYGYLPSHNDMSVPSNIIQKLSIEVIESRKDFAGAEKKEFGDMDVRSRLDQDGLPLPDLDILTLQKFQKLFEKIFEKFSDFDIAKFKSFSLLFPPLGLLIKFLAFVFLRNRDRPFFKNFLANEILDSSFVSLLTTCVNLFLRFDSKLQFTENFFNPSFQFDYSEKLNFILKMTYSSLDDFRGMNQTLLFDLKKTYDCFFSSLIRQTKSSSQGSLKSPDILLKIFDENDYPFKDCLKIYAKHSDPDSFSKIEVEITEVFPNSHLCSLLYLDFDEKALDITHNQEEFKALVASLDALQTEYDSSLEIKLMLKEDIIETMTVPCSSCENYFEVENTLMNKQNYHICPSCQNKIAPFIASKPKFGRPF